MTAAPPTGVPPPAGASETSFPAPMQAPYLDLNGGGAAIAAAPGGDFSMLPQQHTGPPTTLALRCEKQHVAHCPSKVRMINY